MYSRILDSVGGVGVCECERIQGIVVEKEETQRNGEECSSVEKVKNIARW